VVGVGVGKNVDSFDADSSALFSDLNEASEFLAWNCEVYMSFNTLA
jgi:hypothetical protein